MGHLAGTALSGAGALANFASQSRYENFILVLWLYFSRSYAWSSYACLRPRSPPRERFRPLPRAHRFVPRGAQWIVAGLAGLVGLGALYGGVGLLVDAQALGAEESWLEGTPFPDYRVPGVVLLAVIGGGMLTVASAALFRSRFAGLAALAMGLTLLVWGVVETLTIGYRGAGQLVLLGLFVVGPAVPLIAIGRRATFARPWAAGAPAVSSRLRSWRLPVVAGGARRELPRASHRTALGCKPRRRTTAPPGDLVVADPLWESTRAITIDCRLRPPALALDRADGISRPTAPAGTCPTWLDRLQWGIKARSAEGPSDPTCSQLEVDRPRAG